ncbi:cell wall synthesis protein CwsA [Mycobacterium sp.]|uniref:cell wall synthesis protein CwsA n=1 Tax=Mycobacterium sp. TaxID=1785 RepID=UPI0031D42926
MSSNTDVRLTPRQRLTRGLTYTALGPVDVTRGVVALGVDSAQEGASRLRRRYQEGRLARDLQVARDAVSQEVAAGLQRARRSGRHTARPWLIAGVVVALAVGAAAFSVIRRSSRPEPSTRPPSVEVQPRP